MKKEIVFMAGGAGGTNMPPTYDVQM